VLLFNSFSAGLAGGFHEGGLITPGLEHASFKRALVMHSGGEVPIIGQEGEFMMNRWSTARIGKPALDYMNETGRIPNDAYITSPRGGRDPGGMVVVNHFHQPKFTDRRSQAQVLAQLSSSVKGGNRNL